MGGEKKMSEHKHAWETSYDFIPRIGEGIEYMAALLQRCKIDGCHETRMIWITGRSSKPVCYKFSHECEGWGSDSC